MKIKRYDITIEAFRDIFSGKRIDWQATRNPIPKDAELIRIWVDQSAGTPSVLSLFFASSEFGDLQEGEVAPRAVIEITTFERGES